MYIVLYIYIYIYEDAIYIKMLYMRIVPRIVLLFPHTYRVSRFERYIRIRLRSYTSIGFGHRVRSAVPEKSCCYYMQCALGR